MKTPAQKRGIIVGATRLKLADSDSMVQFDGDAAMVWFLSEDDGTENPFFASVCGTQAERAFTLSRLVIIQDGSALQLPPPPALTLDKEPLPTVSVYTELQEKAITTFQGMYDAAVAYREGQSSRLNGDYGICDNIERFAEIAGVSAYHMSEVKENLIRSTAIYSGDYTYPVPSPDPALTASNAFSRHGNKWREAYGLNRLTQLGQLIELIKTKWDDSLINRQTPCIRNGLKMGDLVQYKREGRAPTFWVLRRDDESMSPSFHKMNDPDDYQDIDLHNVVKVDRDTVFKSRPVSEFLSVIEEQVKQQAAIVLQMAELEKRLSEVQGSIAILDYGLAEQHKVKRI
jgi:hypothetical protein